MKERPILFSGEMVRAILSDKKTQTRRVVKPQSLLDRETRVNACYHCPYGAPGEKLWVRETWAIDIVTQSGNIYCYRADGDRGGVRWKPSIFMPRRACRIALKITAIRVERLQEITEDDARAEGISGLGIDDNGYDLGNPDHWIGFRHRFWWLWDKLHAKRGYDWRSNPWVWVIEFERI